MLWFVLRRLALLPLLVVLISIIIFGLTQALPGSVAQMILGEYQNPEALAALELKLGLKDPLYVQYGRWFGHAIRGQFGESLVMNRPIAPILRNALWRTAALAILSLVSVTLIGIDGGVQDLRGDGVDAAADPSRPRRETTVDLIGHPEEQLLHPTMLAIHVSDSKHRVEPRVWR